MSISSKKFCSSEDIEKRNSETTNEKEETQKYEKRILQCLLAEKIIPMDLKHWPFFLLKPEFISQIHTFTIYDYHGHRAVIVTKDKNIYSLNYNKDEHSKTGDIHNVFHIKQIEELCGKNIKTLGCSLSFVLALTTEGEVYFWKFDKCNFTERGPVKSTPIRFSDFSEKHIVDIAYSDVHFLVLTSDGEVYAWEDKIYMPNNKNTDIFNGNVKQVKHGLEEENVVHIACGKSFNMVITNENKLYGWGSNTQWQISNMHSPEQYVYPREIIIFPDKIVKMVCGYYHTLALSNKGEIYAWGNNSHGQVGVNNNLKSSDPILVNLPQMGKVLNVDAYGEISVAVGYDRSIYIWGHYFHQNIIKPFRTKFSRVLDVFAYSMHRHIYRPLVVRDSVHTVRITNNYNYKHTEEVLNILESLEAAFDDPFTSDFTIQVEGQPIYVHKAILNNRCRRFFDSISDSSPVYIISDKFSYVVYKAFLKYMYSGTIDLPLDNALELMELAEMYCETNLKEDCSQMIKQKITVSNVAFLYNKAIEYNAKELEEFCFQFISHHTTANTLSEDYIKLDISSQDKFIHGAIQNDVTITSSTFSSSNKNVEERNLEITIEKREMQNYDKRTLQCVLAEKIISIDLKRWLFFHVLKPEFIPQIHMVLVYDNGNGNGVIIVTLDKNVYSLDYKEEYSKTGDTHAVLPLRKIEDLCGKNIKTFAHSSSFILALTEEGEVYFCEIAKKTIFSRNIPDVPITFILVVVLSDARIVDIACGNHQYLVLTSDGEVYAWGKRNWEKIKTNWNDLEESNFEESDSQFGNENTAYFSMPRQVKHKLERKKVVHIACSLNFNIVVTDENKIYGWGNNKVGQISIVQAQKHYVYPRKIITLSNKIVKVVCGSCHTLALTNKGEVYAWGANNRGQVGVNNNCKPSGPTVVNVPEMGKVLDIAAYNEMSVAVNYDKIIFVWGLFYDETITIPVPTKFSSIHDAFFYSPWRNMHRPLIVFTNNSNYIEEVLNILEFLGKIFDDPLTNDLTIRVEGQPIYVHKAILKIRCQYFKNMFQHDWIENIQSISDSVYTVSDKFSYVVYKAFLKYLYTGIIDLPSENALELMELADMYCEANLVNDCSQIIKKSITVSNVAFFYNKAIECNAKELEEFCFQFALRHMEDVVLSEVFIKLDTSTKDNFMRRAAKGNIFDI